jgi:transglutaminase-like putative cysteine protease
MGVLLFTVVAIGSIYWLTSFLRSFSHDLPSSRRETFTLGYPRASMSADPVITPVDEVKKMPERLPQVDLGYVPIAVPMPVVERSAEVLPNFTPIPSKIEESLLFRSLTLAMFAVSVFSLDFAAGTHFSLSSIPFAAVGAVWSWYRRHHAKHWLNIAVSIASLGLVFGVLVPILFKQIPPFPRPFATLGLMLGAILISLNLGLSFHLYSRRILGYCLLISVILLAVAAGISQNIGLQNIPLQNIGFFIVFCGFMRIAIPTLMLDYRSRLALQPIGIQSLPFQGQLSYQHLPWKYLNQLVAISIGLGIILAIFLPNFHLPDLSFKPPAIDNIKTLAQQYRQPPNHPPSAPSTNRNSPPPVNQQELARKVFGQPNNNNYPDTIKQENLQLPPELSSQLQQFTQQILATSPQPLNSDFDRSTYIAEYLKQHHQDTPTPTNTTNLPPLDPKSIQVLITQCSDAPKTCKLVGNKQDLPVVYTSMLRSIGIPSRMKTGEQLAQIDPQTKLYPRPADKPVSQTEMYSPNWGWVKLDSTPDRPVVNLTPEQIDRLQAQAQQQLGVIPSPSSTPTPPPNPNSPNPQPDWDRSIADAAAREPEGTSGIERDKTDGKPFDNSFPPDRQNPINSPTPPADIPTDIPRDFDPTILKVTIIIMAIIGGIVWYLWYRNQAQQQLATLPPIERIYRSMIASLSKTGNAKVPAQTQLEYARSIKNTEHPQIAKIVEEISQLYTAWRYGNQKIDVNHLTKKLQNLQHLQQLAANRKRQQWIANQKALWMPGNTIRK